MADFLPTSIAFAAGGTIPRRHSCDGEDRSPPLSWTAPPTGSRSLALILDDPDAPGGRFVHWLAWGIPPDAGGLAEGKAAPLEGRNDFGTVGYRGPCPPRVAGVTATASGSTPSAKSSGSRPAPAWPSWSGCSRATSSRLRSSSAPTNADHRRWTRSWVSSSRNRTVDQGSALHPACAHPRPSECQDDQHRPFNRPSDVALTSVCAGQSLCGAPRRNRTGDPILTMEPPGTAVRNLVAPARARP
jgi:Phosphatidylethanolamine-binding protein